MSGMRIHAPVEVVFYEDAEQPEQWCPVAPNEIHLWALHSSAKAEPPATGVWVRSVNDLYYCQLCLRTVTVERNQLTVLSFTNEPSPPC